MFLFRKLSVNSLINNLRNNKNRHKDKSFTRKLLAEQLGNESSDLEVETSTLKVKLDCPLMKTRLKLPGRSLNCKHVQCFDIENFLLMNEKKSTWACPICDIKTTYDGLIIDELHLEILEKNSTEHEIEINLDGTWNTVNKNVAAVEVEDSNQALGNDDVILVNGKYS